MVNTLDALIVAAGAYYATTKLQDDDTDFERLALGAAAGIPVALKGPEAYQAAKQYFTEEISQSQKDKLAGAAVAGGIGYIFGDKVLGDDTPAYKTTDESE